MVLAACTLACPDPSIRAATDSIAAAAADSARARTLAVPPPPRPKSPLSLSVQGSAHFKSDSGFTVSCVWSESNGEKLLQVEALGRDAHVSFTIYNARDGEVPVGNLYTSRRAKARVGNLDVTVGARSFADGIGRANLTDPLGREGTITAHGFVKMGARKGQSHGADLTVHVRWICE